MTCKKALLFILLIFSVYIPVVPDVRSEEQKTPAPEVTGIDIQERGDITEITITSNHLFSFTSYKPADPYRLIVELQGVEQGRFRENIMVDRAGVMEIIPGKAEGAEGGTKLEIILTVPADIQPVQKENSLILSFINTEKEYGEPAAEEAAKEAVHTEEEPLAEAGVIETVELVKAHGKVHVLINGDGKMNPRDFQPEKNRVIVDIPNVTTSAETPKVYEPPVGGVRIGAQPDKTRVVIDLTEAAPYRLLSEGKQVIVSFDMPVSIAGEQAAVVMEGPAAVTTAPELQAPGTEKYEGEVISIDIQDAPLSKIFAIIAEVSGYNIILSPQVKDQRVFIKLNNVPWDQALDVILRNYTLSRSVEGNIMRIAPTDVIREEERTIAEAKEAEMDAGDLETRMYSVNFGDLSKLKELIEDLMKKAGGTGGRQRGSVSIDSRTNTLIIKDVARKHEEYRRVIESLDSPTRQVSIEAKIVEVTKNFTNELGIQWGLLWKPTPQTTVGGTSATGGTGFFTGNPLLINLPAAVAAGTGGAAGFGYIGAENLRALDIQLSAMESSGKGKIISNPKIVTLDHHKASIEQGKKIPYPTVSSEGTQTNFANATLELSVTPHITPNGSIVMDIGIKKDEADFSQTVGSVPTINTNEAKSQVLINDSDTLVIGGIFKTRESKSQSAVPLLGRIPILGWLFRSVREIPEETSELLIFITPRIVK